MVIQDLAKVQPYIRMVKIKKSVHLEGAWEDLDYVLIYIAEGSLDYILEGRRYHMAEGDFILIPPYMHHLIVKTNTDPLIQYVLHFDFYMDEERMKIPHQSGTNLISKYPVPEREKLLEGKEIVGTIRQSERYSIEKLFLSMYHEFSREEEGYVTMLKGMAIQFLTIVVRCFPHQSGEVREEKSKKTKSWKLVENALEYICLHYNEELDNVKIAEAIHASPNYLSKLFQDYIGVSLHMYLLNYRLDRAQEFIMSGRYNITETALKCGFSSVHAFSKVFKQKRGLSPSAYMEMFEENNNSVLEKVDYNPQKQIYFNQ